MLGVATLTLGSSSATTMVAQKGQPQYPRRQNLFNRTDSLPLGLKSSSSTLNGSFFSSSSSSIKEFSPSGPFTTAVAAVDSDQLNSSDPPSKNENKKYYFVVANAKFMLDEEEHFQEQLFERRRYYGERDKEQDFWLVIEPKFLDRFPDITKRLKRPAVALVSTNGPWIT
ncbi:ycf54 isoform A [Senna tora]|uniref:Ycf54 isoform A n=1 Tax=Senna tora TaxID=362788 RepID=A0A834TYW0_9FABA|nr:ycf54 isoform A [Senna tora]